MSRQSSDRTDGSRAGVSDSRPRPEPEVGGGRGVRRNVKLAVAIIVIAGVTLGMSPAGGARAAKHTPGSLITSVPVSAPGVDGSAFAVKYWSKSARNRPVMVTGLVIVPTGNAPGGGWPVVSWGHPTDGMGNPCAPSLDPSTDVPSVNSLLDRGWEVTATDYQGEGNQNVGPTACGLQPHGVNVSEAHNMIDIVRAAAQVSGANPSTNYVVWGFSQGGGAAVFSGAMAASYAPELHLRGAVATAPSSNLTTDFFGAPSDSASPFTLMYVAGYHSAYGGAVGLGSILTQTGMSLSARLSTECYGAIAQDISPYRVDQVFKSTNLRPRFQALLNANDPLSLATASVVPLLMVQGAADTTNLASDAQAVRDHLSAVGQDLVLWMYPGLDHNSIVANSTGDVVQWIAHRFAGQANPDYYAPTGVGGIQSSLCN